jgi:hypothetical protein
VGSGFGASQSNGQVWLGTMGGVVQSWSDTQLVALVAPGSNSGSVQILQNGILSNAVPFTVNTLQITDVSPSSGVVGTHVTITGTGFGTVQGTGTVLLGSTAGQVLSWSDTQVVAAVAAGALSGVVRIQQNGASSNAGWFIVSSGGSGNTLVPSLLNMAVGDTHTVKALSAAGQPVAGLTWTSSDPTVVSLSTDDPPVLTALAVGHVTITAGSGSADVTVSAGPLALGTVLWSNSGDGSGVYKIVPAVPSSTGVADVFAFQNDGTVQAITSDGTMAWTADVSNAYPVVPDFQGGLVMMTSNGGTSSIVKLDGITGQPYPAYSPGGNSFLGDFAVHPDGTVFSIQSSSVVGIDPTTGAQKFSVSLPGEGDGSTGWMNGLIVAGDGYAYLPYFSREGLGPYGPMLYHLYLLRVSGSGASDNIKVFDFYAGITDLPPVATIGMITNADTGVLFTWAEQELDGEWTSHAAITTGTSVSLINVPVPGQEPLVTPVLQAQDGSFIGTAITYDDYDAVQYSMIAFDAGGNLRWSVPGNWQPQIATADGGVVATELDSNFNPVATVTFDQNGNATGQISLGTQSWTGNQYQLGSVDQVLVNWFNLAASFWGFAGGNASGNGTASMPATQAIQQLIAQIAGYYANPPQSADWENKQPANQCNQFVHDVLVQAGDQAPLSLGTTFRNSLPRIAYYLGLTSTGSYPASAGDWAYPHNTMACWHNVPASTNTLGPDYPADHSILGDVIAEAINYSDASGHVGIIGAPQQTVSADSAAGCISPGTPPEIIDITNYGFRPDGWASPQTYLNQYGQTVPCSTSGWKSNAVVKRFVCQ